MQLNVSGRRLAVTPAIRAYVSSKIGRLERHFDQVIDAHVILSVHKLHQKAEATLRLSGKQLHCASSEPDLYAAIDRLADKLDRQLLKHKGRRSIPQYETPRNQRPRP